MIKGTSGRVRVLRTLKVKTGYVVAGPSSSYPKDCDFFVGKAIDGWTKDKRDAYSAKPVSGAKGTGDEQPWDLGKELRGMLAFEVDALSPDGRELSLELLNRSWAQTKLRCSGDGGDEAGEALCRDEDYKTAIARATKTPAVALDGGGWSVKCLGPRCVMWHKNRTNDNKLPGCHAELRFHFILLHPTTNPADPNYMKQLGWAELASGSYNAMLDIQSAFAAIRGLTATPRQPGGRTALIPFALKRVARTLFPEGKRVVKWTLMVDYETDEVLRFGLGPASRALLRPDVAKQLAAAAAAEAQYDSVIDIQPQLEERRRALPPAAESEEEEEPGAATSDREEVVDQAASAPSEAASLSEKELKRFLDNSERAELKRLAGHTGPDTLDRFKDLVRRAYEACGEEPPDSLLSMMRVRHAVWMREQLAREGAA